MLNKVIMSPRREADCVDPPVAHRASSPAAESRQNRAAASRQCGGRTPPEAPGLEGARATPVMRPAEAMPPGDLRVAGSSSVRLLRPSCYPDRYLASDRFARDLLLITKVAQLSAMADEARQALHREIRIAESLSHPHVMKTLCHTVYRDTLYIYHELPAGEPLAAHMRKMGGRLEPDAARAILAQMIKALEYCHQRNVLHRDVRPENIVERTPGTWALTHFGRAGNANYRPFDGGRWSEPESPTRYNDPVGKAWTTMSRSAAGEPRYMSRLALQRRASRGTDLHALGVVYYEMLMGRCPYLSPVQRHRPGTQRDIPGYYRVAKRQDPDDPNYSHFKSERPEDHQVFELLNRWDSEVGSKEEHDRRLLALKQSAVLAKYFPESQPPRLPERPSRHDQHPHLARLARRLESMRRKFLHSGSSLE